jgi:hypothetical protein
MKRKLFTACALLSLLFGTATVWWWTGSRNRIDQVLFERHGKQSIKLWGSGGKLLLTRTSYPPASATNGTGQVAWSSIPFNSTDPKAPADPRLTLASFSYASQPIGDKSGATESTLVLPAWLLVMVFGLLPAFWLASRLKGKKKPAG